MQHSTSARDLEVRPSSRVVVCGSPGASARPRGERLAGVLGVAHISARSLIARLVSTGTALGSCAERCVESAILVPDQLMVRLVLDAVHAIDEASPGRGFVLTGFPRTIRQAEALEALTCRAPIDLVVQLTAPSHRAGAHEPTSVERTHLQRRLSIYRRVTVPALAWLSRRRALVTVDVAPPAGSVKCELATIVERHLRSATEAADGR